MFAFVSVLALALIFLLLTVFRQSKFSVVYATLSTVCWSALGGLNLVVFETTPSFLVLSWLWFVIAVVSELVGLYITFELLKVDKDKKDFEV